MGYPDTSTARQTQALDRIATALERIAVALEADRATFDNGQGASITEVVWRS